MLDNSYEELRDLIYLIPSQKDGWIFFAKRLVTLLNASYIHIQAIDFSSNVISYSNGVGPLPLEIYADAELNYLRYPIEADPRWGKFLDPDRVGWYQCHSHVTDDFVENSALYQQILLPIGLRYVATHELLWDEKICVFWSISTSESRGPLQQQDLLFLNQLLPHLKNVMQTRYHLFELSLNNIVGYNLINQLKQPIILLSLSGQVVHYNQTMHDFLTQNTDIKIQNHQLILPEAQDLLFAKILYQIEDAFRYRQNQLDLFKYKELQFIVGENQHYKIMINFLVSEKEMSFFGIRPLVMLTFYISQENKVPIQNESSHFQTSDYVLPKKYLKEYYHLTKREIDVCSLFVNGQKLEQIGQVLNLKLVSIRTYIKNIFGKTACNSQVELMKLLVNLSNNPNLK